MAHYKDPGMTIIQPQYPLQTTQASLCSLIPDTIKNQWNTRVTIDVIGAPDGCTANHLFPLIQKYCIIEGYALSPPPGIIRFHGFASGLEAIPDKELLGATHCTKTGRCIHPCPLKLRAYLDSEANTDKPQEHHSRNNASSKQMEHNDPKFLQWLKDNNLSAKEPIPSYYYTAYETNTDPEVIREMYEQDLEQEKIDQARHNDADSDSSDSGYSIFYGYPGFSVYNNSVRNPDDPYYGYDGYDSDRSGRYAK